jgi:hypothetical protein
MPMAPDAEEVMPEQMHDQALEEEEFQPWNLLNDGHDLFGHESDS